MKGVIKMAEDAELWPVEFPPKEEFDELEKEEQEELLNAED